MNSRAMPIKIISTISIAAALCACGRYAVTLNEQPIYTPPALYSQFSLADEALLNCVKQTIIDQKITSADALVRLTCRHAGVKSLTGLDHFSSLEELDVSFNDLQDISSLNQLKKLRLLKLNDNPALRCDQLISLEQAELTIVPPKHCDS
ncbi:hypothetical protein DWB84_09090 [Saccharophagus sp. K07]|jgi:Leucine-rich repeat (LRR) protein|uniref:hypothetical protein n=1 Tax=Saccharophagus sp. K07 TaxID=2283636 RepID=UPI0016525316|nr:hypothetical protein [Saccharophagus sp. K07]MBC6905609.1 hypothetical protein [Saccharophagus sp. K07]